MSTVSLITYDVLQVLGATWWIFVPIILLVILKDSWMIYSRDRYIKAIEWVTLEIKVPSDILKTPKAMEQVFAAMYGNYSHGPSFLLNYVDGYIDYWFSFEIAGDSRGIRFYVYIPTEMRNLVESAIYSQYPDAEIHETEDYTEELPHVLPNKTYDLWGTDLIFARETFYPIRTYPYFEEAQEEKRLDPMSAIAEVMSGLKDNERIWWQVIVCPSDNSKYIKNTWKEEGEKKINEVAGRVIKKPKGFGTAIAEFVRNFIWAPLEHPLWGENGKQDTISTLKFLSPAEQEVVKAIDSTISKLGFETIIRFVYIAPKEIYSTANGTAVMGSIRQFNTQNLNYFRPGQEKTLLSGWEVWRARFIPFYKKLILFSKKKKLFSYYKLRRLNSKMVGKYRKSSQRMITFNTEELATVYHYPTMLVESPTLLRLGSKKGGPPSGLPIE